MSEDIRYKEPAGSVDFKKNSFRDADKYLKATFKGKVNPVLVQTDFSPILDMRHPEANAQSPDGDRVVRVAYRSEGNWVFELAAKDFGGSEFIESKVNWASAVPEKDCRSYTRDISGCCGGDAAEIYAIKGVPGVFILSKLFSYEEQLIWALRCLTRYADSEYTNLINLHFVLEQEEGAEAKKKEDYQELFWKSFQNLNKDPLCDLRTLRWASLGYHYDWTARTYHEDNEVPLPKELVDLSSNMANQLNDKGLVNQINGQAGIINFYPVGSKMGAHVDDAEPAVDNPIVNCTSGLTGVFLIGSKTRAEKPIALYLRSGDVLVQDGPARLAFHAIARIVENSLPVESLRIAADNIVNYLSNEQQSSDNIDPVFQEAKEQFNRIKPLQDKYNMTYRDTFDHLLTVQEQFRVNYNVRQVTDERNGKPSEVRSKVSIADVLNGVYAK